MRTTLHVYRWLRDNDPPDWIMATALAASVTVILLMVDVIGEAIKHTH